MKLSLATATAVHAPILTALRNAAAQDLTRRFGPGHWSGMTSERSVLRDIEYPAKFSRVLLAKSGRKIVATLRLQTKKPWAIDASYFTPVPRALYLVSLAVDPKFHGQGIGRWLMDQAANLARDWPAQSIRLDAYDAPAGAAEFYSRCGYRERGRVTYRRVPLVYFETLLRPPGGKTPPDR